MFVIQLVDYRSFVNLHSLKFTIMKYLSFIILFGAVFGFKSAIKNEVVNNEITVEKIVNYNNLNKNLIINNKEDLQGFWLYDFRDLDDEKYYGKFILLFEKIKENKVVGKFLWEGKTVSVVFDLKIEKDKFKLLFDKKIKTIPFRKFNLEIDKGFGVLEGEMMINDYEGNIQTFKVEIPKKNFEYNIDNVVEAFYVDFDKKGMGYREYGGGMVIEEVITVEELNSNPQVVKEESKKDLKNDDTIKLVKNTILKGETREGYLSTTDTIFKINPSKEILKNELVENLTKADLYILRNLVYAKHGMIFKNDKLREFFMRQSWYIPVSSNVISNLTEIERKNIDLIERYEQNAKEYFQVFGR